MRILIDGRTLNVKNITGVQRYTADIIQALKSIGVRYDVAVPDSSSVLLSKVWEQAVLPAKAGNYDILFCPANISPLWKFKRTKVVTAFHGFPFYEFPEAYSKSFVYYYRHIIPLVAKISDKIIAASESEKSKLSLRFPEYAGKIIVVPNCLSPEFQNIPDAINSGNGNYILYVGSMNPVKNLAGALRAFGKIVNKTGLSFYAIGPESDIFGKSKEIEEMLRVLPKDRVKFVGYAGTEDLKSYYRGASCLVFPSFYEGSGLPPLEAMACGCPVVASDIPSLVERCGDAALYCRAGDAGNIAEKIMLVINDKNLSQNMVKNGKERVKHFSSVEMAEKTFRVFKETVTL